jgi:hypothetical protein
MAAAQTLNLEAVMAQMKLLEAQVAALRGTLGGEAAAPAKKKRGPKPRAPDAPKREPNDWIKFTQRLREALEAGDSKFKMAKHTMAFAKHVKNSVGMEATAEQILAARGSWEPPAAEVAGSVGTDELREELRAAGKAAIESGADIDAALQEVVEKRRGRPAMTAEQKAAAKAERAAKKGSA